MSDIVTNIDPLNQSKDYTQSGDAYERITIINKILKEAQSEVSDACRRNESQILALITLCGTMIVIGVIYGYKLIDLENNPPSENLIYSIFTRAVIVTGVFYTASYTFKILKSYLHLYQRNTHRLMVIKSMASFVGYQTNPIDIQKTYNQLLDIIVNFDKNGILKDDDESFLSNKEVKEIITNLANKTIDKLPTSEK